MTPKLPQRVFTKVDLETLIKKEHGKLYKKSDFYRPISIAIQGNNYCSLGTCPGCGISSSNKKNECVQLPKELILDLLKQARKERILIYYTNFTGEITDDLDFLGVMLKNNPLMDAHKINTNCEKFSSVKKAKEILTKLKNLGWTRTNYVTPTFILSVGMQQHKVPLKNVINGVKAFREVFKENEAHLLISHYYTPTLYNDTLSEFKKLYKSTFKEPINDDLIKTEPVQAFGRARNYSKEHFEEKPLKEFCSKLNCFSYWAKKYLSPEIYVHRDGSIYTCPLFEPHEALKLGNAKKDSLKKAIKNANSNKFLRDIATIGTKGIYDKLVKKHPELKKIKVTNRHEACKVLSEYYPNPL
jgi:hypothetical protein